MDQETRPEPGLPNHDEPTERAQSHQSEESKQSPSASQQEKSISGEASTRYGYGEQEVDAFGKPLQANSVSGRQQTARGAGWQGGARPVRMPESLANISFREQYAEFVAAVRFLSILPLPTNLGAKKMEQETTIVRIGGGYFPLVGLIFGLLLWLVTWLLGARLPYLALTALCVVEVVILTGGLHLDGLMDSFDGLFGGRTRERKLEIMRDSRVGSFGVLSALCALLLKWAFLGSIAGEHLIPSLLITLVAARWAMLLTIYVFPSARSGGLGVTYRQAVTRNQLLLAGILSLIIVLIAGFWLAGWMGLALAILVWVCAIICALLLGNGMSAQLGGLTGDSYGAIEEMTEVILLFVLVLI